jgi:hypothetical protein
MSFIERNVGRILLYVYDGPNVSLKVSLFYFSRNMAELNAVDVDSAVSSRFSSSA